MSDCAEVVDRDRIRRRYRLLNITLPILIGIAGVGYAVYVQTREPFDPLETYETQVVETFLSRTPQGAQVPGTRLSEPVIEVSGAKCANADSLPIAVRGSLSWQPVGPRGPSVSGASGTGVRYPRAENGRLLSSAVGQEQNEDTPIQERRCALNRFVNPLPPAVIRTTRLLAPEKGGTVEWIITGSDLPYGEVTGESTDGMHEIDHQSRGRTEVWTTEVFTLVNDLGPVENAPN